MRFGLQYLSTCVLQKKVTVQILEVVLRQIHVSNLIPYVVFTGLEIIDSFEQC